MYDSHKELGTDNAHAPTVLYRNDNFDDWSTNARHVGFIELNGPVFGGFSKGCTHCYEMQKYGSVSASQVHSKECPFTKFIFDKPIMEAGVSVIMFQGKNAKKNTKNHVQSVVQSNKEDKF